MSWIWEDYSEENEFIINRKIAPYLEVFSPDYGTDELYVNILIRFSDIFSNLCEDDASPAIYEDNRKVFNASVHFLAHMDRLNGLNAEEFSYYLLSDEIKSGVYGSEVKELFFSECVTPKERRTILKYFRRYQNGDQREDYMPVIFLELFRNSHYEKFNKSLYITGGHDDDESVEVGFIKPSSEIYYDSEKNVYYYYCGNNYNKNKFRLIKLMFSDVTDEIIDIYGKNFGLIGEKEYYRSAYPEIGNIKIV